MKAFWPAIIVTGILKLLADLLAFVAPFCIGYILDFVDDARLLHNNTAPVILTKVRSSLYTLTSPAHHGNQVYTQ